MLHLNLKQNYITITCLIDIRNILRIFVSLIIIITHPYFFIKLYQALFFVDFKAINIDKKTEQMVVILPLQPQMLLFNLLLQRQTQTLLQ